MQAKSGIFVSTTGLIGLLGCLAYTAFLDHSARHEASLSNPIRVWIVGQEAVDGFVTSPAQLDAVVHGGVATWAVDI